ncbi:hypothetical protein [Sphingomonas aquatilis]
MLGLLFALVGLYFLIGGGMLIARGGSWYYLLMGLPCWHRVSRSPAAAAELSGSTGLPSSRPFSGHCGKRDWISGRLT